MMSSPQNRWFVRGGTCILIVVQETQSTGAKQTDQSAWALKDEDVNQLLAQEHW